MVVSGVPVRNGNRHLFEIATMALDIQVRYRRYRIYKFLEKLSLFGNVNY